MKGALRYRRVRLIAVDSMRSPSRHAPPGTLLPSPPAPLLPNRRRFPRKVHLVRFESTDHNHRLPLEK